MPRRCLGPLAARENTETAWDFARVDPGNRCILQEAAGEVLYREEKMTAWMCFELFYIEFPYATKRHPSLVAAVFKLLVCRLELSELCCLV